MRKNNFLINKGDFMKNIAVLFGGKSVEHDISIITALQVMANLPKNFNLIPIYIKTDGKIVTAKNLDKKEIYLDYNKFVDGEKEVVFMSACQQIAILKSNKIKEVVKIDCALLCNHGHGGEDGSLQGLLDMCEIPYTSCSVPSSAVCMDKVYTKVILEDGDILTPAYVHFTIDEFNEEKDKILQKIVKKIKLPCIIKPARLGSSVGISICENEANLENLIFEAFRFDDKVIVEKFIENASEYCCAVVKNSNKLFESNVVSVKKDKMFTFEDKYLKEKENGKSQITKTLENKIKCLAKECYKVLSCSGVVRVDFLYDEKNGKLYVNEVNSIPGSLAFNLFDFSFVELLTTIINEGIERKENQKKIEYKFNSQAIENFVKLTDNLKVKS